MKSRSTHHGTGIYDLDLLSDYVAKWERKCAKVAKRKMIEQGRTYQQLADAIGITKQSVHRIVNGTVSPRYHHRLAMASALGCDHDDIWPTPSRKSLLQCASNKGVAA